MAHEIHPSARRRLTEIWRYTNERWGEEQADRYLRGLYKAVEDAAKNRHSWRRVPHERAREIHYIRYRHHYVFFRELEDGVLGVVSVLHENMDIPNRLREDHP